MRSLFLFRRNTKKNPQVANPKGWPLHFSKSGVVTIEVCANMLAPFLGLQFQDPTCVIMDSAPGHITVTTLTRFKYVQSFWEVGIIRGGLTQLLPVGCKPQPAQLMSLML